MYLTWEGLGGVPVANAIRLRLESEAPDLDVWLQQRQTAVPVSEEQITQEITVSARQCYMLPRSSEWGTNANAFREHPLDSATTSLSFYVIESESTCLMKLNMIEPSIGSSTSRP